MVIFAKSLNFIYSARLLAKLKLGSRLVDKFLPKMLSITNKGL